MKRAILNLRQANNDMYKSKFAVFNKIVPNTQVKIPDNKNSHPPLSRPVNKKKKEDKNKEQKEEKYEMFLL